MEPRSIQQIKANMEAAFMANTTLAKAYGFEPGDDFGSRFGQASIENLLLYIVACAMHLTEQLVALHTTQVQQALDDMMPHSLKWYRHKALQFVKDLPLPADSDTYDTSQLTEAELLARRVVKYAAVTETRSNSTLNLKVATQDSSGCLCPLDTGTENQLYNYMREVKDAGVHIYIINLPPEGLYLTADVYYSPLASADAVEEDCRQAVAAYVSALPFNGEYTNLGVLDAMRKVQGVVLVDIKQASAMNSDGLQAIDARYRPLPGYMQPAEINLNLIAYDEQSV